MPTNKMVSLFVYGTLKKGFPLYKGYEQELEEDSIQGAMFNLGWYPGILLDVPNHLEGVAIATIKGERHLVPEDSLPFFDMVEGSQYQREYVELDSGHMAWVYVYKETQYLDKEMHIEENYWSIDRCSRSRGN